MNALTGHCVSSCHSVMGTSFSCGARGKRTVQEKQGGRGEDGELEKQSRRDVGDAHQRYSIQNKAKSSEKNKNNIFSLLSSTMPPLCDQTLVMWREKLNKFLMTPATSGALKICCS